MNLPLIIGFLALVIFAIGVLIGQGLNGRAQIVRDKLQAEVQRDLNERRRAIERMRRANQPHGRGLLTRDNRSLTP